MPKRTHAPAMLAALLLSVGACRAVVPGYTPPAGYDADPLNLTADTFAVASDGRLAVGINGASGATVTVYNHADPNGRIAVSSFSDPSLHFLGGLAFSGADTLYLSENGAQKAVYSAALSTGTIGKLASVPDVAQVRVRPSDGALFAVSAGNPGHGALYEIIGNAATPFVTGIGAGYLGGVDFDGAGDVFVADTNDPNFAGNAGRIREFNPLGQAIGSLDLSGGGGSGAYDVARAANGDFYATTGGTLTRVSNGASTPFGVFDGAFPFPTDIGVDAGGILVNGGFTNAGGLFRIHPTAPAVPEPATLGLLACAAPVVIRRKRR